MNNTGAPRCQQNTSRCFQEARYPCWYFLEFQCCLPSDLGWGEVDNSVGKGTTIRLMACRTACLATNTSSALTAPGGSGIQLSVGLGIGVTKLMSLKIISGVLLRKSAERQCGRVWGRNSIKYSHLDISLTLQPSSRFKTEKLLSAAHPPCCPIQIYGLNHQKTGNLVLGGGLYCTTARGYTVHTQDFRSCCPGHHLSVTTTNTDGTHDAACRGINFFIFYKCVC